MASTASSSRWFRVLAVVLFVAMALELGLLVRQNRKLKTDLAAFRAQAGRAPAATAPALEVGETVAPLTLAALDGGVERVDYAEPDRDTVLFVFSPNCPACQAGMGDWKRLQDALPAGSFWYVSTADEEQTRDFAADYEIEPVILGDVVSLETYRITHTPTTIVVGPGGIVRQVWVGLLPEDAARHL